MYSSSSFDNLAIGLELIEHADPLGEDGRSVLDGDVDRVERVEGLTFAQVGGLTLLQRLDGLVNHGCGLPKFANQLPVF